MDIEYMIFAGPNSNSAQATKVLDKTITGLDTRTCLAYQSAFMSLVFGYTTYGPNRPYTTWVFQMVRSPDSPVMQAGSESFKFFSADAAGQQAIVDAFIKMIGTSPAAPPAGKHHK